jgi:hypothetical protein
VGNEASRDKPATTDPLNEVSFVPRDGSLGGKTFELPLTSRNTYSDRPGSTPEYRSIRSGAHSAEPWYINMGTVDRDFFATSALFPLPESGL